MPENKDKLDLDLNFLDSGPEDGAAKKKNGERKVQSKKRRAVDEPKRFNLKTIAIIIAVIIGIVAIGRSNDNSNKSSVSGSPSSSPINRQPTSPAYPPTDNGSWTASRNSSPSQSGDSVTIGSFRCSRNAASQADRLRPNSTNLKAEQAAIDARWQNLDNFRVQLESRNLSPYSQQDMIDHFNYQVRQYNSQLATLQGDSATLRTKIDQFNSQVASYNNYLISNCTKVAR